MSVSCILLLFCFLFYIDFSKSTEKIVSQDLKQTHPQAVKKAEELEKDSFEPIYSDGHKHKVNKKMNYRTIIQEHESFSMANAMQRRTNMEVLAYVTPWNNHGYDIAKIFAAKFTMLSPVWLQLKPIDSRGGVLIEGLHDIDQKWMEEIRQQNKKIKIVPRIIFDDWTYPQLKKFLRNQNAAILFGKELANLAKKYGFQGYVLEMWSLLGGHMKVELTKMLLSVITTVKLDDLEIVLVVPPPLYPGGHNGFFDRQDFDNLKEHVSAFSIMTYDYSNRIRPGPTSPLPWMLECIESLVPDENSADRGKILLGLNLYGNKFYEGNISPIIGPEYIKMLKRYKPVLVFDNVTGEHSFTYKIESTEHHVYYPTLYTVQLRIKLAQVLGTGVALWEIGQGLDYFYELL